jgi:hypothetical protein
LSFDKPENDLDIEARPKLNTRFFLIATMVILSLALVMGIYGLVTLLDLWNSSTEAIDLSNPGGLPEGQQIAEIAEVLPQQRRVGEETDSFQWDVFEPYYDPFADPMKLTGIVVGGSRGGAMAIIESRGISYIVSPGDYVDDLWAVSTITRDKVVLKSYNSEISLYLDKPPVTRSLDIDPIQ